MARATGRVGGHLDEECDWRSFIRDFERVANETSNADLAEGARRYADLIHQVELGNAQPEAIEETLATLESICSEPLLPGG